jgi:hypothetical protein
MRRILLGGLGLVLGAATPALSQQPAPTDSTPARAAKFGRPAAVPAAAPAPAGALDPAVTQAGGGLLRNGPSRPLVSYAPGNFGTPTPVISQPPGAPGVPMQMPVTAPPGNGIPPPRPVPGGPPMVTESRDPTGRIPGGTLVPSVAPDGWCPESCPTDDPFCAGQPAAGLDRVRGVGSGRNWVSAELLLWWSKGTQVPPLVTTSSPQFNGIPGLGNTTTLLGGSFGETFHAGGRIGMGHWFDDCQTRGVDARLFWVSPTTASFSAGVPPYTLLARPFFNVNPTVTQPNIGFGPSAEIVAGPGVATGGISAKMTSMVWGADANYRRYLWGDACDRVDFLIGYRYLDVREELTISESFARVPGSDLTIGTPAVAGVVTDRFRTENHFHGGQVGLASTTVRGRWSLDTRATIAFGTVFQSAEINGTQALMFPNGAVQTAQGGLYAVPGANIGTWKQSRFAVVPEVGVNVGYQLTSRIKVFVGYNFLYLSSAVRPGEAINPYIDAARVPNLLPPGTAAPLSAAHPTPQLSTSGYFVQGISFGLVFRW